MIDPLFHKDDLLYVQECYAKFKRLYDDCLFVGIPTCPSYGGLSYSPTYKKLHLAIEGTESAFSREGPRADRVLDVFLSHVVTNFDSFGMHGGLDITYLDERYKNAFTYHEYDGEETFGISMVKYVYSLIEEYKDLDDKEFGRKIREAAALQPHKYGGECARFLSEDETTKCRAILDKFVEAAEPPKDREEISDADGWRAANKAMEFLRRLKK